MSLMPFRGKCFHCGHDHDQLPTPVYPYDTYAQKPADEQPIVDVGQSIGDVDPTDRAESAYWHFDARRKGYGAWKGTPMSERDAFKAEYRQVLALLEHANNLLTTPRPADPGLLALADEIEGVFMGLLRCKADCGFSRADDLCDCGMSNKRTRLRELAARIRKGVNP